MPYIYFKIFANIIELAKPIQMSYLLLGWSFGGILYLFYGVVLDMYCYIRILREYKTDSCGNEAIAHEDNTLLESD